MAATILLVGTGTAVGKTHVGECLLRILAERGTRAYGYKPIESGVTHSSPSDTARLTGSTTFHVKPEPLRIVFEEPISPHLAARAHGTTLDLAAIRAEITRLSRQVDVLLVELPGGVFSPLTDDLVVGDFVRTLPMATTLLVAPDRLGVLHDVGATTRACAAIGLPLLGLVLSAPPIPDESTGRNADELRLVTSTPLLATFPRGTPGDPFPSPHGARLLAALTL